MMATQKSIVEAISAAHFLANEEQVGRLAYAVQEGQAADVTYLRVILAHTRSQMARAKRGTSAEALLDKVHDRFYPVVLRTVGSEEMPTAELNSRANFARSAASTVRYFIRNGGDVRSVDLATVTKSGLRKAVAPEGEDEIEGETKAERALRRLEDRYVKSLQRITARGDPDAARERIEAAIGRLEELLAELGETAEPEAPEVSGPVITRHTLQRQRASASAARRAA